MQKISYISNRELLLEIQRSKTSYCHFVCPNYTGFDAVVTDVDAITADLATTLVRTKMDRLAKQDRHDETVVAEDIIFRVMTDSHIPMATDEKCRKKSSNGEWIAKTNFPPFRHYRLVDGMPQEVGRSHWKGDFDTGEFSASHGKMTRRLAEMFMLLVDRYSKRGNWRNYSYIDEMKCAALTQLSQVGLQFDESRGDNPFAWYTQIIKNVFRRVLLLEKRNQDIRDDLLIMSGALPSHTRQMENELEQRDDYDGKHGGLGELPVIAKSDPEANPVKKVPAKRGRKPKIRIE